MEYNIDGTQTPCCLLKDNPTPDVEKIQKDLLNEIATPACQRCWDLERQGKESDRILQNRNFDYQLNKDIELIEQDCRDGKNSLQSVKIWTSRKCNGACVVCGPYFSTTWRSLKNLSTESNTKTLEQLDNIDWANLKQISLIGGEPLYESRNFDIMQKLIDNNNQNCFVTMVTNGSVELKEHQIEKLSQLTNLNFCLSIDGVGSVHEYVRWPLKWDRLVKNIELYRSLNIDLCASYTISNLNVFYYQETTKWFKDNNIRYNHNLVTNPGHFNINSLPKSVKEKIDCDLFRPHVPQDDILFEKFIREIKNQDSLKNISIKDYLPEFVSLIENDL
jgi:hypothetical protein